MNRMLPSDQPRLALTERDIERRKAFVGLEAADVRRILAARGLVEQNVDRYLANFFQSLQRLEEAAPLFASPAVLADIKERKREHLLALVGGHYGVPYAESRLGSAHGDIRLDASNRVIVFVLFIVGHRLGGGHQVLRVRGLGADAFVVRRHQRGDAPGRH